MNDFSGLDLIEPLRRALSAESYSTPTPIQAQSIPHLLARRDLLGVAQTGTGKTAAFVLPMLQTLVATSKGRPVSRRPRALVLAPTRELAVQIGESVRTYGRFSSVTATTVFGGAPIGQQIRALSRGVDIVIATPGRLLDLLNQNKLRLDGVDIFVLDEADRMLDMGFIGDVRKIAGLVGTKRQTVLFSATMPNAVAKLADDLLSNPLRVEVAAQSIMADRIEQRVLFVEKAQKRQLLSTLLENGSISRALVFTRTKHGADRVARHLEHSKVRADAIHGNKSQNARQRALNCFKNGQLRVLVATDIAARGIDVDGVTHVINFDLPQDPETYVHRIGRTARAGAAGHAISFCDRDERNFLFDIEKLTQQSIEVVADHPFHAPDIANAGRTKSKPSRRGAPQRRGGNEKTNSFSKARQRPNSASSGKPRRHRNKRPLVAA